MPTMEGNASVKRGSIVILMPSSFLRVNSVGGDHHDSDDHHYSAAFFRLIDNRTFSLTL